MKNTGISPAYRLLTLCSLILFGLVLFSCNIRENSLLPPNLDPKEYIIESTIRVYSDHLIKSSNDDTYIYIPKESISDSLLWYNDRIVLEKVDELTERDSLAFDSSLTMLTNTYKLSVIREGSPIILDSIPGFATLYTDRTAGNPGAQSYLLSLQYIPQAQRLEQYSYASSRCFFDLDGSGEFTLSSAAQESPSLSFPESGKDVQALLFDEDLYLQAWIPSAFTEQLGSTQITVEESLGSTMAQTAQQLFPGFAVLSKVITINTERPGSSSSVPILHYRMLQSKTFGTQWIKLADSGISAWPQGDNTWKIEGDKLITFVNGSGTYFLLNPVGGQNSLELALDSSYRQIYLEDIWLDLKDTNLSGIKLRLDTQPPLGELYNAYFKANPYTLCSPAKAYGISFYKGNNLIETLPGDAWIEFGFRTDESSRSANRLMRIYRDASDDHLDYKSWASAYDDGHYTISNGFVYSGINSSGTYLYGLINEPATRLDIPRYKANLSLQTAHTNLSWSDNSLAFSTLSLEFNPSLETTHPWLNGLPYNYIGSQALMKISTNLRGREADELPDGLYLESSLANSPESIINFSARADYPKFYRYRRAQSFDHNTYLMEGKILKISPAVSGWLIDSSSIRKTRISRQLALFSRMIFDDYDLELYLDSATPMPASTLEIYDSPTLTDRFGVLASQYSLAYLSAAYSIRMLNNPGFYQSFSPLIRIKQTDRRENLLFSISDGDYYRIYTYHQAGTADGWSFSIADGHIAFYLAHDAQYAVISDQNPHTEIDVLAFGAQDKHVSLYQAQMVMPQEHIGNLIPAGSHLTLRKLSDPPTGVVARSVYQVLMRGPQLTPLTPAFYSHPELARWPFIYIPVPDYVPGESIRLFYRSPLGVTTELHRVQTFDSVDPSDEFVMVGNSAVCFINNPGIFYTTSGRVSGH